MRKMKRKDGSALPVEVNANQQKDGRFIIFARDITDRNKLQAQQLLFASIVDATDDAILTTSLDGTITSWNHGAEKTYGYAADEMIGKQITRLIPAHLHRQEFDMLHKIKNGEVIDHFQTERIKKNGESIYVSLTISPLKDAAGNIIGAAKISRDITGQKEAREKLVRSEQIYRTIASSIPGSIICLLDTDFRYVLIEGDLVENIGYSKEILLGRTIKEAFGTEAFENVEEDLRSVLQGETVTRQIHHNGYDLISRFIPLNDENNVVYSIMTVALDITEIKNAQRSILELNENLERKVIERTEQLEAANIELQQFAYIASHDLQQPLRTVSNYMQIFEEDYKGQLDARALKYIVSVNNATKRMSSLIHSLLEFSKLTHTKKRLLTNCNNLIADVLADLDTLIKNNNAIIEIGEMPHLHLYEIEMRQLFQNLVLNAIKFQPPGNRPLVKIYSERKDDKWQFSVSDNGIGIEPEYFDRIFDIFKRLHTNNAYEGSGIGLANCKKIVQLHHGEIWVESTVGVGSTFYFTIQNLEE